MIIALFALAVVMIVGGIASVVQGFPFVRLESGLAMVIAGATTASAGAVLLGIATLARRLRGIERALGSAQPSSETSRPVASEAFASEAPAALPEPGRSRPGIAGAAALAGAAGLGTAVVAGRRASEPTFADAEAYREDGLGHDGLTQDELGQGGLAFGHGLRGHDPVRPDPPMRDAAGEDLSMQEPSRDESARPDPALHEPDLYEPHVQENTLQENGLQETRLQETPLHETPAHETVLHEPHPHDPPTEPLLPGIPAEPFPEDEIREQGQDEGGQGEGPPDRPFLPPEPAPPVDEPPPLRPALDAEPEPARPAAPQVVGTYASGGNTYAMFSDGSIEAETPRGRFTFDSLDELKAFVEAGGETDRGAA